MNEFKKEEKRHITDAIPEGFRRRMEKDLGIEEAEKLIASLDAEPAVSIRINAAKCRLDTRRTLEEWADGPVTWCEDGLRFLHRPEFITDPLLHAGVYYVQEAGSMYYQTLIQDILEGEDYNERPLNVLDLCAAPGGKSTAILNALHRSRRQYTLVANEYDRRRVMILAENLQKWDDKEVIVTNSDAQRLGRLEGLFDIVAVDAPCSGEGMMRREPIARTQWSDKLVDDCAALQRRIVDDVLPALRKGGYLIYSTCTFNHEENEENVAYFTDELGLTPVGSPRRFMPHQCECEGLFVALFRKNWGKIEVKPLLKAIQKNKVQVVYVANNDEGKYPYVDLSREEALEYLRGMALKLHDDVPQGIVTVGYNGYPLGRAKNIGTRANNLYPKEWRIRKK